MEKQDDIGILPSFHAVEEILSHVRDIKAHVKRGVVDIDEYDVDNGVYGNVNLSKRLRYPSTITHLVAIWDTSAATVTLTLGDRVITLPPSLGVMNLEMRMNLLPADIIKLDTSDKFCYLEIMGFRDPRKLVRE